MIARRLYTPGPLTTSATVREAMTHDSGSRDAEFTATVQSIRATLAALAAPGHAADYAAVLLPGSGTYAVEATIGTCVPDTGRLLIASNGAYGERMRLIAERLRVPHTMLRRLEYDVIDPAGLRTALDLDRGVTHVALVHLETTTGLVNPLADLAAVTRARGVTLIVDAMSSFGALPIDADALGIQYLIASSNKCLEGAPGLAFVVAERRALSACAGRARSVSLDLVAQLRGFDQDGQFRFTPPTHVVLALGQALRELADEGGIAARGRRYARNQAALTAALASIGLVPFLSADRQGPVITTFHCPPPPFEFDAFYAGLHDRGFVIYPGKLTAAATFRIGSIGQLFERDMLALSRAVREVLSELGVEVQHA